MLSTYLTDALPVFKNSINDVAEVRLHFFLVYSLMNIKYFVSFCSKSTRQMKLRLALCSSVHKYVSVERGMSSGM
jgi:hypothetical protein